MSRPIVLACLLLGASGCLAADPQSTGPPYQALGEAGGFAIGFAYDGTGVQPYLGFAYLDVDDATNWGVVKLRGNLGGAYAKAKPCLELNVDCADDHSLVEAAWFNVTFSGFEAKAAFQGGGIVSDLVEHGDSGVGDPDIPKVDMERAGWGWASVTFRGEALTNPVLGGHWNAHFMVVRNGVRDDTTGAIWNGARTGPYDPAKPGDAATTPGSTELLVEIETGTSDAYTPQVLRKTRTASFVTDTQVFIDDFHNVAVGGQGRAYINITGGAPGPVRFELLSPSGRALGSLTSQASRMGPVGSIPFAADELGNYYVRASGLGAQVQYSMELHVVPQPTILNLWFDKVTVGPDAVEAVQKWNAQLR